MALLLVLAALSAGCGNKEQSGRESAGAPERLWTASHFVEAAFSDTLYGGPLILERADSFERLSSRLDDMYVPAASFFDAYRKIKVLEGRYDTLRAVSRSVLRVDYEIGGKRLAGYAYFKPRPGGSGRCAALVIPGSGRNQSTAILTNAPDNYHYNIAKVVEGLCDLFVYVKPNEDFLAIHNGTHKLGYDFIVGRLINRGGSYSALYLTHTLAIAKYLQASYEKLAIIGISQGGKAALLNSLQSRPDCAIVSSGFSVLEEELSATGPGQILIPGLYDHYGSRSIHDMIKRSPTRYLFTYGKLEDGVYGIEAWENVTRDYFRDVENMEFHVHKYGHRFPVDRIRRFLLARTGG